MVVTSQQAYPFPKREGGHPNFVALIDRLYKEHNASGAVGGLTIIAWDTDHTSPLIKEAFTEKAPDNRNTFSVLTAYSAKFINEGVSEENAVYQNYKADEIGEKEVMEQTSTAYSEMFPDLALRVDTSYANLWKAAKKAGADIFYPEVNSTKKPFEHMPEVEMSKTLFVKGGVACGYVYTGAYKDILPEPVRQKVEQDYNRLWKWRSSQDMNEPAAASMNDYKGDRNALIHFGSSHSALYGKISGEKKSITMITSERTPWVIGENRRLEDYVYFAAEDKVVPVPTDVKERAAFIERLAHPKDPIELAAQTKEQKLACMDTLLQSPELKDIGQTFRATLSAESRAIKKIPEHPSNNDLAALGQSLVKEMKGEVAYPKGSIGRIMIGALEMLGLREEPGKGWWEPAKTPADSSSAKDTTLKR